MRFCYLEFISDNRFLLLQEPNKMCTFALEKCSINCTDNIRPPKSVFERMRENASLYPPPQRLWQQKKPQKPRKKKSLESRFTSTPRKLIRQTSIPRLRPCTSKSAGTSTCTLWLKRVDATSQILCRPFLRESG